MVGHHVVALPDFFDLKLAGMQQDRTCPVAGGDEYIIVHDQGAGGINRGIVAGSPALAVVYFACLRVEEDDSLARKENRLAYAVERGGNGR